MALTRKMLSAMDISAEKIDEIITAHTESINALKDEKDRLTKEIDELKNDKTDVNALRKDLEDANAELDKLKNANWEKKYNDLKGQYDSYKTDVEAKEVKAAKTSAYRKLLANAGVSTLRLDSVLKVSDVDSIELDDEGNVKDADKITESVKTEWADFIGKPGEKGANVSNPPELGDTGKPATSRAAERVANYRKEHYGGPKED